MNDYVSNKNRKKKGKNLGSVILVRNIDEKYWTYIDCAYRSKQNRYFTKWSPKGFSRKVIKLCESKKKAIDYEKKNLNMVGTQRK